MCKNIMGMRITQEDPQLCSGCSRASLFTIPKAPLRACTETYRGHSVDRNVDPKIDLFKNSRRKTRMPFELARLYLDVRINARSVKREMDQRREMKRNKIWEFLYDEGDQTHRIFIAIDACSLIFVRLSRCARRPATRRRRRASRAHRESRNKSAINSCGLDASSEWRLNPLLQVLPLALIGEMTINSFAPRIHICVSLSHDSNVIFFPANLQRAPSCPNAAPWRVGADWKNANFTGMIESLEIHDKSKKMRRLTFEE